MGLLKILDFSLDDFKEIFDTRLLIPFLGISLIWIIIDYLMNVTNFEAISKISLFGFMIILSVVFLMFLGVKADMKEKLEITKVVMGFLLALLGIYAASISVGMITGNLQKEGIVGIVNFWKIISLDLPKEATNAQPIVINFISFATALSINPNLLYKLLTHWFLVAPAEELSFRGVGTYAATKGIEPLTGVNAKGGVLVGGIISTGVWASIHTIANYTYQGSAMLTSVLTAYIGGAFFLLAMIYSGNIVAPIIAHAIFNSVIEIFKVASGAASIVGDNIVLGNVLLLFIAILITFAAVFAYMKKCRISSKIGVLKHE